MTEKFKKAFEALDAMNLWIGSSDYTESQLGHMLWKHQEAIGEALLSKITEEGTVKIPTSMEEAKLMALLGMNYLEEHNPEQLKPKNIEKHDYDWKASK